MVAIKRYSIANHVLGTNKKTKIPVVLTKKSKDAEAYLRQLDIAAAADAREGIGQGLLEAKQGKGRNAEEFFAEFEATHGIELKSCHFPATDGELPLDLKRQIFGTLSEQVRIERGAKGISEEAILADFGQWRKDRRATMTTR